MLKNKLPMESIIFMKVSIGDGHFIHIRAHQRQDGDGYDFYSLHETFKHNKATCIFKEGRI